MDDGPKTSFRLIEPANDGAMALQHVNDVVMTLATLLGRRIAREEFERRRRETLTLVETPPQDD
jgi:hypothetical protein